MTALPFIAQPALVALAIFVAWTFAVTVVVLLFSVCGHRDDVFRYDTAPTGEPREGMG